MQYKDIIAVDVYLERRKAREYVGQLKTNDQGFVFTYDSQYLYKSNAISMGPDLPLSQKKFTSKNLFMSFEDRLPSKRNPAYSEYCKMVDISESEKDPLVLLSTLGQKGPSSFIFAPVYAPTFIGEDLIKYRKKLCLSVREFSELFDFSYSTINKIEKGKAHSNEILKRVEIYHDFPEVALREIERNHFKVNDSVVSYVRNILSEEIKNN